MFRILCGSLMTYISPTTEVLGFADEVKGLPKFNRSTATGSFRNVGQMRLI